MVGTVDVHNRAQALISQGANRWEAYRQAVAEVKRYGQLARCDRCAVVRTGEQLRATQLTAGEFMVVCHYCQ